MFTKKTIKDINIQNKRVIHRVAFDVPVRKSKVPPSPRLRRAGRSQPVLDRAETRSGKSKVRDQKSDWEIVDDLRLKVIFPTLFDLLEHNCRVVMLSYMGRPQKKEQALSLEPVASRLSQLVARRVKFVNECIGKKVEREAQNLKKGEILLLENTRFHKEEYQDEPGFAKKLAGLGEVFVQDAFAQCHRCHASVTGITKFLPSVAGFYLKEEVENLESLLSKPKRPLVVILGGAKISDKIKLLEKLVKVADFLLVGGISGDVFLKAKGYEVGRLKKDLYVGQEGEKENVVEIAKKLLQQTEKIILPVSRIATDNPKKFQKMRKINFSQGERVPNDWYLMDTGEETVKKFASILQKAGTIFWNGPIGQTELVSFQKGTRFLLEEVLKSKAVKFVSGGDTLRFVQKEGALANFDYFSAGGGASLSFLAGEKLPGIEVLPEK